MHCHRNPPDTWIEGRRRSRLYGPDGRPLIDLDKPHQGNPTDHVHDWINGVRGEPDPGYGGYSPWPKK